MKDLLLYLSGTYNNRYTIRGKKNFINSFSEAFKKLGYNVEVIKKTVNKKPLINLYIGNLNEAKVILVCPYDTPKITLLPNYKYYPLNYKKNIRTDSINHIIEVLISVMLIICCYKLIMDFKVLNPVLGAIGTLVCLFFIFILNIGIPAPYNFNRSTAAVTISYSIAEEIKSNRLAVIYCDQSLLSYEGINEAKKYIKNNHSSGQVIYLDCISDGEDLFLAHSKKNRSDARIISKNDKSLNFINIELDDDRIIYTPLSVFDRGIFIGRGYIDKSEVTVYKTRGLSDCQCNFEELEKIKNVLISYINYMSINGA